MKRTERQIETLLHRSHPRLSSKQKSRMGKLLSLQYQEAYPHRAAFRLLPGLFASALVTVLLVIGVVRVSRHTSSLQSISSDLDHMVIEEESFL